MSETKPTYVIGGDDINVVDLDFPTYTTATPPAPDAEPTPVITDEHIKFIDGLRGQAFVSRYYDCTAAQGEQYLSDIIAYLEDRRRAEGWL